MADGSRARRWRNTAFLAFALVAAGASLAAPEAARSPSRVPLPVIEPGAGERCVEDTAFMRRNHMELLRHQRDRTVHEGIRTTKHSLANCVACHAGKKTGRVTGADGFCANCHSYAGVTLDCFECDNCVVYCPQTAVARVPKKEATMGRYVYTDYDKCIGCHICKDVCPTGYIQMGLGE